MKKAKTRRRLLPFDAARYLTDDDAVAEYMNAVLETGNSDHLLLALGDIARARGMAQVAKDTGLAARASTRRWRPARSPGSTRCSRWRGRSA